MKDDNHVGADVLAYVARSVQKCRWKKLYFIFMEWGRCLILWTSVDLIVLSKYIWYRWSWSKNLSSLTLVVSQCQLFVKRSKTFLADLSISFFFLGVRMPLHFWLLKDWVMNLEIKGCQAKFDNRVCFG